MSNRSGGAVRSFVITTSVVVLALVIGLPMLWRWLGSPFKTTTVDRSAPTVLASMRDLSEYRAASGEFEQVVDLEKDVSWLPSALAGERVMFIGVGTVDSYVDFSNLDESAIEMSKDRKSVTITLPEPTLAKAVVDVERSHVANRDRGLLNRLGGIFSDNPTSEQDLYRVAAEKIDAAASESELRDRAKENTTTMLEGLLKGLGFTDVEIRYEAGGAGPTTEPPAA